MEQFLLNMDIPRAEKWLQHGDEIILLGSCFSDELALKLSDAGHRCLSNPFGTIFHPSMLAFSVLNCFEAEVEERILKQDDVFFSWDASSAVFAYSEKELRRKMTELRSNMRTALKSAKYLFVTFGTAWGYELSENSELVANCHKQPSDRFTKFLSSPYELVQDWILALEKLRSENPELEVVFTVSPVRHIRDGVVENNLSKARLIEAVHQLSLEENASYFPSYELVVDVLRDYRFYAEDLVHPSKQAVDFVWKRVEETYFSDETIALNRQVEHLRKMNRHEVRFAESIEARKYHERLEKQVRKLLEKHPEVNW